MLTVVSTSRQRKRALHAFDEELAELPDEDREAIRVRMRDIGTEDLDPERERSDSERLKALGAALARTKD